MTRARVDHVLESLASRSEFESLPVGQMDTDWAGHGAGSRSWQVRRDGGSVATKRPNADRTPPFFVYRNQICTF